MIPWPTDHATAERQAFLRSLQDEDACRIREQQRKREEAIAHLRKRGRYILDQGTPTPCWGVRQREPGRAVPANQKERERERAGNPACSDAGPSARWQRTAAGT